MRLVPGLLVGGTHLEHECHTSRSIGYYLEAIASLAPFAKHATEITLRGVTNDDRDPSVQYARWLMLSAVFLGAAVWFADFWRGCGGGKTIFQDTMVSTLRW